MGDRIESLTSDVRSLLRTGVSITCAAQCVEELVVNSLDAGATCIAIRVDLPCFKIQVVDNGKGIKYEDFPLVGERYATSKCHEVSDLDNLCYFGYRGEALASLRDVANILEINSRSKNSTQTFCKIFQQGTALPVTESTIPRSSSGSTVTVHDLFYNLPVRKKCCNATIDFERIRQNVERIALMKPSVSISLRNDVSGHVVLQTHKTNSILNTFNYLFGPGKCQGLKELSGKEGNFSINGYVSKKGCNKKDYQFIYINGRNVLKTKIHKTVNHLLAKSLILRKKLELTTNKFRGHVMNTSPTKTTDQYAMYVLDIKCPYKEYDITFEPAKTLVEFRHFEALEKCIENTINEFLKSHNLHLGILAENFRKKNQTDNGEESDFVGLRSKDEIKTTDRNGLFSKIVKRPVSTLNSETIDETEKISESMECDINEEEIIQESSRSSTTKSIESSNFISETPCDQHLKAITPHTPKPEMNKGRKTFGNSEKDTCSSSDSGSPDNEINPSEHNSSSSISSKSSDGEFSENPIPRKTMSTSTASKKNFIRIDTPFVKEAKISVSSLSKLRKRRNVDECPSSPKSPKGLDRLRSFTKLKGHHGHTSSSNQTCSNTEKSQDTNPEVQTHTSSLQRLRNLRNQEENQNERASTTEEQPFISSLQELRKFRQESNSNKEENVSQARTSLQQFRKLIRPIVVPGADAYEKKGDQYEKIRDNSSSSTSNDSTANDDLETRNDNQLDRRNSVRDVSDMEASSMNGANDNSMCESNVKQSKTIRTDFQIPSSNNEFENPASKSSKGSYKKETNNKLHPIPNDTNTYTIEELAAEEITETSSPIDIDKACDEIENCVTEIESFLVQKMSANPKLDEEKRCQIDFSKCSQNEESRSDVSKSKFFMTSENLVQTAESLLPSCSKCSENAKDGRSTVEFQDYSTNFETNSAFDFTSSKLMSAEFNHGKPLNFIEDYPVPSTFKSNFLDNNIHPESSLPAYSDGFQIETSNFYRPPVSSDTPTYMSYFDIGESQNCQNTRSDLEFTHKYRPFDIYMDTIGKYNQETAENEVDESLMCTETMADVDLDQSQTIYYQTQAFTVNDDLDVIADHNQIDDVKHLLIYEEGENSTPKFIARAVSPCLSEGFDPQMESEGFSPDIHPGSEAVADGRQRSQSDETYGSTGVGCEKIIDSDADQYIIESKAECFQNKSLHAQSENDDTNSTSKETLSTGKVYDNSADLFIVRSQAIDPSACTNTDKTHSSDNRECFSSDYTSLKPYQRTPLFFVNTQTTSQSRNETVQLSQSDTSTSNVNSGDTESKGDNIYSVQIIENTPINNKPVSGSEDLFSPEGDVALVESESQEGRQKMLVHGTKTPIAEKKDELVDCFSPDGDSELCHLQLESKTWVQITDPKTGQVLYINTRSGNTVSSTEWTPPDEDEQVNHSSTDLKTPVSSKCTTKQLSPESCRSLRIMMDEKLSREDDDLSSVKWKNKEQNSGTQRVEDLFKEWDNPVFAMAPKNIQSTEVNTISRASTKSYQALNPCVFDKDMLQNFKVLGQVDNKFIACSLQIEENIRGKDMLVLIDQHAAHERVRLEDFTRDVYENKDEKIIKCTDLTQTEELNFPEEAIRVMTSFTEEFARIGIKFTLDKNKRDSISLHSVPTCFVQKDTNEAKKKNDSSAIKHAKTLIQEYTEVLLHTRGSKGRLPSTIHKVLCSQACHGAIKFGDPLELSECEELLKSLAKCKLPFQCAHGRPSVVPLIQLSDKKQEKKRPNLWKIAKNLKQNQINV